jgi:hypothetical protein
LWNWAGAAWGAYEIVLSRNRILVKMFYDLNPREATNVLPDKWRNLDLA